MRASLTMCIDSVIVSGDRQENNIHNIPQIWVACIVASHAPLAVRNALCFGAYNWSLSLRKLHIQFPSGQECMLQNELGFN